MADAPNEAGSVDDAIRWLSNCPYDLPDTFALPEPFESLRDKPVEAVTLALSADDRRALVQIYNKCSKIYREFVVLDVPDTRNGIELSANGPLLFPGDLVTLNIYDALTRHAEGHLILQTADRPQRIVAVRGVFCGERSYESGEEFETSETHARHLISSGAVCLPDDVEGAQLVELIAIANLRHRGVSPGQRFEVSALEAEELCASGKAKRSKEQETIDTAAVLEHFSHLQSKGFDILAETQKDKEDWKAKTGFDHPKSNEDWMRLGILAGIDPNKFLEDSHELSGVSLQKLYLAITAGLQRLRIISKTMNGQGTDETKSSEAGKPYFFGVLQSKIGCSAKTLGRYAKLALVRVPSDGEKNLEYQPGEWRAICAKFIEKSKNEKHKTRAAGLLDESSPPVLSTEARV